MFYFFSFMPIYLLLFLFPTKRQLKMCWKSEKVTNLSQSHQCSRCQFRLVTGHDCLQLHLNRTGKRPIHTYHAVPLPCRAAKGLECVFPIWFTECSRVWFTLAMLRPCRSSQGHSTAVLCCGLEKNGMVAIWHGHSMASVNQTRPHCVNKMGKTHSKPLAARHGRRTACYVWIGLKRNECVTLTICGTHLGGAFHRLKACVVVLWLPPLR